MLDAFLTIIPEAKTGKILIQRNEKTLTHKLLYTKLPGIASTSTVILLDPMLATGGSVILAIKEILEHTEVICSYFTRLIYFILIIIFIMLLVAYTDVAVTLFFAY